MNRLRALACRMGLHPYAPRRLEKAARSWTLSSPCQTCPEVRSVEFPPYPQQFGLALAQLWRSRQIKALNWLDIYLSEAELPPGTAVTAPVAPSATRAASTPRSDGTYSDTVANEHASVRRGGA